MMNRIKELRKLHGYSQAELSEMLNVHQTAISQWERGNTFPDIVNLKAMAGLFGVSTDYLLGADSEPVPVPAPAFKDADLKFALWGGDADTITEAQLEEVRRFAKFVAERDKEKK